MPSNYFILIGVSGKIWRWTWVSCERAGFHVIHSMWKTPCIPRIPNEIHSTSCYVKWTKSIHSSQHHKIRIARIYNLNRAKISNKNHSSLFTWSSSCRSSRPHKITILNVAREQFSWPKTGIWNGVSVTKSIGTRYFCSWTGHSYHLIW